MKPFDLEAAMRGEPLITRNGLKAKILKKLHDGKDDYNLIFLVTDNYGLEELHRAYNSGRLYKDEANSQTPYDLFMATKTKKLWIGINTNHNMSGNSVIIYETTKATSEKGLLRQDWKIVEVEIKE